LKTLPTLPESSLFCLAFEVFFFRVPPYVVSISLKWGCLKFALLIGETYFCYGLGLTSPDFSGENVFSVFFFFILQLANVRSPKCYRARSGLVFFYQGVTEHGRV
jgi:hypothetical protein